MGTAPANTLSLSEEDILVRRGEARAKRPAAKAPGEPAPSVIAKDVVFTGDITAKGCVQIDGTLEGNVECGTLITGDDTTINGSVTAESALIAGRVTGPIKAGRLMIQSGAQVLGDIEYKTLRIDANAAVEGQLRRVKTGEAPSQGKDRPAGKSRDNSPPPRGAGVVSLAADRPAPPRPAAAPARRAAAPDISAISQLAARIAGH